ncbi:hypothetical protein V565_063270 [Rhizoctonia solani 123E]|uniref:Uncharacterized protein n=1 Tax=Rhizoctonia solani 123E TaxID=1423351 RepID=A0A074S3A6_9AGAM|nr:hypothetical protein V565_063270 [Rhizoctonia solani 123E]
MALGPCVNSKIGPSQETRSIQGSSVCAPHVLSQLPIPQVIERARAAQCRASITLSSSTTSRNVPTGLADDSTSQHRPHLDTGDANTLHWHRSGTCSAAVLSLTHYSLALSAMTSTGRSRFLISESALKLSLTPPPSATGTDSLSCASSTSSSSSSFAVRRKQFRATSVPNHQHEARVHSESSSSLVSLGIVLVVSGAQPDPYTRRPLKRPHRAIEREPKEKNPDGQTKEQPRYKPPPPHVPLTVRRRQRALKLTRTLPLYHPLRPLPPLPSPADSEPSVPVESQNPATRSSGRTRRPPPRNLEHLIVAVSNTAKQRQTSPTKKRKVVVIADDDMDMDIDFESETGSLKKKTKDSSGVDLVEDPAFEETDSSSGRARRAARRNGGKDSVTPTPPPQEHPAPSTTKTARSSGAQAKKPALSSRSTARRVTRRNSDETSSEEKDTAEPALVPTPAPAVPRRTSARRSAGIEHAEGIAVSVRA